MIKPRVSKLFVLIFSYYFSFGAYSQNTQVGLVEDVKNSEGKTLTQHYCKTCHRESLITRSSGYHASDWRSLTRTMIDLSATPEIERKIITYLFANYPPTSKRTPKLIQGDATISFTQWQTPTLGQRSRDPIETVDGSIWWAGQRANLIGRIDPNSGQMTEYPLPENAMPHTVTTDNNGNIWYTGNKNGTVGKLDSKTGEITEFAMPNKLAKDPHSAIFDDKGTLWFTLQHSNRIGQLNPSSGDIELKILPTANSRPYGIKIAESGDIWVACNGSKQTESSTAASETPSHLQGQASVEDSESAKNILQVAIGSEAHTTLVAAVQAAQIENVLVNAGPLTVFAPVNDAFAALPEGTVENLLKPENKADLATILTRHAAPGSYDLEDLKREARKGQSDVGKIE